MAKTTKWEDQCKTEFLFAADHFIHQNKGKGTVKILHQLAKESAIPYETLKRWFYSRETEVVKNDNTEPATDIPLCRICGVRPVRIQTSEDGTIRKTHTRCWQCAELASTHRKNFFIICPHCAKDVFLNKADLKRRIDDEPSSET